MTENPICSQTTEYSWSLCANLRSKYHNISIRQNFWKNSFFQNITDCIVNIVPLLEGQHLFSSNSCIIDNKSYRCLNQTYGPNRMSVIRPSIFSTEKSLPPIKLNLAINSESLTVTTGNNDGNTNVEISNLVSGCNRAISVLTYTPSGNNSGTRPPKWKISALQKQVLVLDGFENQRRTLKEQGLSDFAIEIRTSNNITSAIPALQIVNYLAESYKKNNLNPSTVRTYKLALIMLVNNTEELKKSQLLKDFFTALDNALLTLFVRPLIDIKLVINCLREWGPSTGLSDRQLTAKLIIIEQEILKPVIVAPKEKQKGQPILHQLKINRHSDTVLCPVNTYQPLKLDSIVRYIHSLSELIERQPNTPISKIHAIGATLVASSGVSFDDIVSHAFWPNYSVFDSYYRLSRDSTNNLTSLFYLWILKKNGERAAQYPKTSSPDPLGSPYLGCKGLQEERKMAIHSCPNTSYMNYNPPPLNDSATSIVNKTDSAIYGIQKALYQATRPIDYYVHRRIIDNLELNTAEDPAIMFASTMQVLLADIAATGLDFFGKPTELIKTEVKPRQQYTISKNTYRCKTDTAPSTSAATTKAGFNNRTSDRQANFCGRGRGQERSREEIQNLLQNPSLYEINFQKKAETKSKYNINRRSGIPLGKECENQEPQARIRLEESKKISSRSELQNGNAVVNLPNNTTQGLHDVVGSQRCLSTHTDKSSSNANSSSSETPHTLRPIRVKEKLPNQTKLIGINGGYNRTRNTELAILEESTKISQYHNISIRQKFWKNSFFQNITDCIVNIVPLLEDQHLSSSNPCIIDNKSDRCFKQTYGPDRMSVIRLSIFSTEKGICTLRHRSICTNEEQKDRNLLHLVFGQQSSRPEFNNFSWFSNTNVEISNLVSECNRAISVSTYTSSGNYSGTQPPKRKICALQEQALVLDDLENQRRTLKEQGLSDIAIELAVSNER
ncbi:hypothetical protein BB561_006494 [Smittium simulii]|uniref:Uncharacterized protein n=1 Tax=Smittium simulii TaxID=133385 RepID=A0A2T9Y410_9FUNG|nr:hypothetical protein BB561_006494 [Smittium simulii]